MRGNENYRNVGALENLEGPFIDYWWKDRPTKSGTSLLKLLVSDLKDRKPIYRHVGLLVARRSILTDNRKPVH